MDDRITITDAASQLGKTAPTITRYIRSVLSRDDTLKSEFLSPLSHKYGVTPRGLELLREEMKRILPGRPPKIR